MILYIKAPKACTQNPLELINELSNVAGYKTNIQISAAFLYANNKLKKEKLRTPIPYKIASERVKYLE